jgi:hypothetical protein
MNDKYVDIVLVIGLLALVAAAVFLLLDERRSYNTPTRTTPLEQPAPPANSATGNGGVTPVVPGETGNAPNSNATRPNVNIEPVLPDTSAGPTRRDTAEPDETASTETPDERPIPTDLEGSIALDRIGFDYARGNVGACNIPLEPWQHVAVSRDLLRDYGCGTQVIVVLPETIGGRDQVVATVADTMSPSVQRTVNVFISPDEPALEYGLLDAGQFAPAP